MRGKLPHEWWSWLFGRIIPAHAGQTDSEIPSISAASGSSPRMRGKRVGPTPHAVLARIIPAHAGQTWLYRRMVSSSPDHPRACGANCGNLPRIAATSGSSPRMRGKPQRLELLSTLDRIIPAHAGQTCFPTPVQGRRTDHPRACGANAFFGAAFCVSVGSSPRMRGKHTRRIFV